MVDTMSVSSFQVREFTHDQSGHVAPVHNNKKRNRSNLTTIACETCRLKHKKCDGNRPICGRCESLDEKCVYVPSRRKRGPATKVAKATESDPSSPEEFHRQDFEYDAQHDFVGENQLLQSSIYTTTIQLYEEQVASFIWDGGISIPMDYNDFCQITDTRKLLLIHSVLAIGSRVSGNWKLADAYHNQAKQLMADHFDDTSSLVGAAHALFGYHYGAMGDIPKSSLSNSLTLRIFEAILRRNPRQTTIDGVNCASMYLRALLSELDITPTITRPVDFICHVLRLSEQLGVPNSHHLIKIFARITFNFIEALTAHSGHLAHYFAIFHQIICSLPPKFGEMRSLQCRLKLILSSTLATLSMRVGEFQEAARNADQLLSDAQKLTPHYYDYCLVSSLFNAGQIYIHVERADRLSQVLELLRKVAEWFPLALRASDRLVERKELVDLYNLQSDAVVLIPFQNGWTWELCESVRPTITPATTRTLSKNLSRETIEELRSLLTSNTANTQPLSLERSQFYDGSRTPSPTQCQYSSPHSEDVSSPTQPANSVPQYDRTTQVTMHDFVPQVVSAPPMNYNVHEVKEELGTRDDVPTVPLDTLVPQPQYYDNYMQHTAEDFMPQAGPTLDDHGVDFNVFSLPQSELLVCNDYQLGDVNFVNM